MPRRRNTARRSARRSARRVSRTANKSGRVVRRSAKRSARRVSRKTRRNVRRNTRRVRRNTRRLRRNTRRMRGGASAGSSASLPVHLIEKMFFGPSPDSMELERHAPQKDVSKLYVAGADYARFSLEDVELCQKLIDLIPPSQFFQGDEFVDHIVNLIPLLKPQTEPGLKRWLSFIIALHDDQQKLEALKTPDDPMQTLNNLSKYLENITWVFVLGKTELSIIEKALKLDPFGQSQLKAEIKNLSNHKTILGFLITVCFKLIFTSNERTGGGGSLYPIKINDLLEYCKKYLEGKIKVPYCFSVPRESRNKIHLPGEGILPENGIFSEKRFNSGGFKDIEEMLVELAKLEVTKGNCINIAKNTPGYGVDIACWEAMTRARGVGKFENVTTPVEYKKLIDEALSFSKDSGSFESIRDLETSSKLSKKQTSVNDLLISGEHEIDDLLEILCFYREFCKRIENGEKSLRYEIHLISNEAKSRNPLGLGGRGWPDKGQNPNSRLMVIQIWRLVEKYAKILNETNGHADSSIKVIFFANIDKIEAEATEEIKEIEAARKEEAFLREAEAARKEEAFLRESLHKDKRHRTSDWGDDRD